jgi:AraC-like DNA-binding protein
VDLGPGDIVVFPHGDPHLMGSGSPIEPRDNEKEIESILAQGLSLAQMGGGGQVTKFVCGYMACEPQLSQILLAGLPALLTVNIRNDPSGVWVENSIQFSVAKANSSDPGAEALLAKLSEALFIETLRRYTSQLPPGQTGWFAGARDPEVGKALALLHAQPARPWTIADLAAAVGSSRSVLAQRFRHYLGEPPIGYLTRWRLQLGSRMLSTTSQSVAEIGAQVGYDSESAFNRAFKRGFGVPPAQFRKHSKANAGSATA